MRAGKRAARVGFLGGVLALLMLVMLAGPARAALKMPDFSEDAVADQGKIESKALQGKVLVVNFWATFCDPCRAEIPELMKIQAKYRDKGFTVLGICMDGDSRSMLRKFLAKRGVNYPVIVGNGKLARGFGGVIGVPATFLVDRDGNLTARYDGRVSEEELSRDIEKLLK